MIELRTLGALELTADTGTPLTPVLAQPRRAALLCYLALASPRGFHRRDALYTLFWPEHDTSHARHAIRQSLYFLRRSLGARIVVSRGDEELALASDQVRCDVWELEQAMDERRPEAALALYRGELLAGFHITGAPDFERWLERERHRLRERAAHSAWALAEARERDGDATGAADAARRATALSPGDETALRRLVRLLDRLGDRSAAVRAYQAFAHDLEREYELAPSQETRALLAQIRDRQSGDAAPAPNSPPAVPPITAAGPKGLLSARRRRYIPISPWVVSAAVVLLGIGAWRLMPRLQSARATSARERVIVADFDNRTSDSTYGDLIAHIVRNELARAPLLAVVGPDGIAEVLQRMRLGPETRLKADVAREVAIRAGIKVVVTGDVRIAGTEVVVSASVIEASTGEIMHGATETARDSTQVLEAIERLSNGIREGTGESVASIQAGDSLWGFTTSSLAALRKHMAGSRALWRGDFARATQLYEEAVALDPDFAHAYLVLAKALEFAGRPRGRIVPFVVRAYDLRDRLTDRERYAVEGHYHRSVTGDVTEAIAAFQKHIEAVRQTSDGGWYADLGSLLQRTDQLSAAEAVLQEARLRFPSAANQTLLVDVLYALRKDAQASQVLDEVSRRLPEHPMVLRVRVGLLADSGRYDEAHTLAAQIRGGLGPLNGWRVQADLDAMRGRFAEAIGHLRELQAEALEQGEFATALETAVAAARLRLRSGDAAGASEIDALLRHHRFNSLDILSRPYLPLVMLYAEARQPRLAQAWLDRYEREVPTQFQRPDRWSLLRARAATYRSEGRLEEAMSELRQAVHVPAAEVGLFDDPLIPTSHHPEMARLSEELGLPDSAIAVYERYLAVRTLSRTTTDAFELANALERIGALYEQRGDRARAAAALRRFVDLWGNADAALASRVDAARRRAVDLERAGRAP